MTQSKDRYGGNFSIRGSRLSKAPEALERQYCNSDLASLTYAEGPWPSHWSCRVVK